MKFSVIGLPAPQGSKRFVGHGIMIESSKKVAPWREAVANAAHAARNGALPLDGPLSLTVTFWMPRPASLTKKRIADGPCRKPDIDKLIRSSCDALTTAGAIADDARIVRIVASKRYALPTGHAGADFAIESLLHAPTEIPCPYCTASGAGPGKTLCALCSKCGGEGWAPCPHSSGQTTEGNCARCGERP